MPPCFFAGSLTGQSPSVTIFWSGNARHAFPKPPYLTRIEGPPPKRNVVSSSLAGGASSEIPMTAPFPPCGENCAIMGISSLPGPTRSAGLGPGVGCEFDTSCLCRFGDGQVRSSLGRSFPPCGGNCASVGISSLPGPTRFAGLGSGVGRRFETSCLGRFGDGQVRDFLFSRYRRGRPMCPVEVPCVLFPCLANSQCLLQVDCGSGRSSTRANRVSLLVEVQHMLKNGLNEGEIGSVIIPVASDLFGE